MSTISKTIYLDAPSVGDAEKEYLGRAIDSGYVSSIGQFVGEFERLFADYCGVRSAVSTQSGTAAIHMALHELGIAAGDEVIVPALTFVATVNPVVYMGATPVFADIDRDTWNIDPADIRRLVTDKTKAIIPVHLYGNPCDMDRIMKIAATYRLRVIEDATESLGAVYRGEHTGTFGDFGCFSFNGNKTVTTGGGGMVLGRDAAKIDHIRFLVNQAKDASDSLYHPEVGFNYRMTNIEAALGLAQFSRLREFLKKKKEINALYREALADTPSVGFQKEQSDAKSSWWLTCVTIDKRIDISRLQENLRKSGVQTRRIFMPLTEFPPYKRYASGRHAHSYDVYTHGLCLPSSVLNSRDDIYFAAQALKTAVTR